MRVEVQTFADILTAYAGNADEHMDWHTLDTTISAPPGDTFGFVALLYTHRVHGSVIIEGAKESMVRAQHHRTMWATCEPLVAAVCAQAGTPEMNTDHMLKSLKELADWWVTMKEDVHEFPMSPVWKSKGPSVQDPLSSTTPITRDIPIYRLNLHV